MQESAWRIRLGIALGPGFAVPFPSIIEVMVIAVEIESPKQDAHSADAIKGHRSAVTCDRISCRAAKRPRCPVPLPRIAEQIAAVVSPKHHGDATDTVIRHRVGIPRRRTGGRMALRPKCAIPFPSL